MATTANKILVEAKKYIGVSGGTTTHKMFIDTYNSVSPLPQGYAVKYQDDWCDAFISFLAIKTNAVDIIGRECGVDRHISIFKQLGIWNEDGNIVPKPGAIITFHWRKTTQPNDGFADHIGIVEKVEGNYVHTIEGNSNNTVARRSYVIGDGRIRGYAFPRYNSSSAEYSGGSLVYAGNMISQENIRLLIKYAQKYSLKPSFLLAQMYIESNWGNPNVSSVGPVDNNWSGISEPFHAPTHLGISMRRGTARPISEGGYYVHFNSMEDYFKAYTYILSNENGLYKVSNVNNINDYCKGLFRIGGAKSDYAESGFEHYKSLLVPRYEEIKRQNNGKLELIDGSVYSGFGNGTGSSTTPNILFTRVSETGRFYPNQTVTIRNHPSRSGGVVGRYNSGESFSYDSYVVNDGHIWLSYVSYSGERRYVAWRVQNGMKFGTIDEPNSTSGSQNSTQFTRVPETGRFYPNQTVTIRNHPSRSGGVVGRYNSGESFSYDSYVVNDGHIWLSYVSYSGERRYVAWRVQNGTKFGTIDEPNSTSGSQNSTQFTRVPETGRFYPNQTVTIRNHPSRSGGVVGQYNSGESFSYDSYVVNDGHIWLSYVSYSGERRYVAWRVQNGAKFGTIM